MSRQRIGIVLQDACYQHQYIRSKDLSQIVERPERIRAVKIGVSAALARMEGVSSSDTDDDLVTALERLNIDKAPLKTVQDCESVSVIRSSASLDILHNPAVKFIHGDVNGDVHIPRFKKLAEDSWDKIASGDSEIPQGLSQGDLYLCPASVAAVQGALGAVCEGIDTVLAKDNDINRIFAVIRPPGHHCGEDTPEGFCWVNNVAVAAAHAHLNHGINRVVIFDIDLHHGNGTQSVIWQINEETYRRALESEGGGALDGKPGMRVYYGSIHDILSYPCEDGKPHLVAAASVSLDGSHGQWIENVHLKTYESEDHFYDVLYATRYSTLFSRAQEFLDMTGGPGDDVMFFISCGLDACEHEYESMSRHNRKVPTSFYHRFTRDACALSDIYAQGRVVSLLEGGYSDRALIAGTMAHVLGLTEAGIDKQWWGVENLEKIEKATKKRRKQSLGTEGDAWVERTMAILESIDSGFVKAVPPQPSSSRTLRSRRNSPQKKEEKEQVEDSDVKVKKPRKVILTLGPEPEDD